jgi:hypothetical protein
MGKEKRRPNHSTLIYHTCPQDNGLSIIRLMDEKSDLEGGFLLPQDTLDKLDALLPIYHKQAELCHENRAYLAACIIVGSWFETYLLIALARHPKETLATKKAIFLQTKKTPFREWSLYNLMDVALEAGWLPVALSTGDTIDKDVPLAALVHAVRRVRNLVHPMKYLKEMRKEPIVTEAYYRVTWKICFAAYESMEKAMEDLQRE